MTDELYTIGNETTLPMSSSRNLSTLEAPSTTKPSQAIYKIQDEEKNDVISIEDEIYNLAFRPARV